MKKIVLFFLSFLVFKNVLLAQKDTSLERRLQEFMLVNDRMDLEKVLDYTYPKLFTIVPRDKMLDVLKNAFDNEEMSVKLDSLIINTIFPVFKLEDGNYAKVIYSMNMAMTFKETEADSLSEEEKKEWVDEMLMQMETQYGKGNVTIDPLTRTFKVKIISPMVAVKDSYAREWSFVNLEESGPMMDRLFSKTVLNKLATYK